MSLTWHTYIPNNRQGGVHGDAAEPRAGLPPLLGPQGHTPRRGPCFCMHVCTHVGRGVFVCLGVGVAKDVTLTHTPTHQNRTS